jgi:dTDP-4-amino-4,6-dideoxygalactose transaminase
VTELAILGGAPIRKRSSWPEWPEIDDRTEQSLLDALRRGLWSVHWRSAYGGYSLEREFAAAFAGHVGAEHCVSVDHGSSALVIALEALGVGPSDEVIVPCVTWVAPATSVLRVGAQPVIADVDPITGCLTPETIEAAMSTRTRAVILVHLACTVADLKSIVELCRDRAIGLIEDCAQAHGSRWSGRSVGTFGDLGVYSFGASKSLAGGEGGGVVTNDGNSFQRLQELRADSRSYTTSAPRCDQFQLVETASVMGANYCMSEFTAALLLDQLSKFEAQNERRTAFMAALNSGFSDIEGIDAVPVPVEVDRRGVYEFAFHVDSKAFSGARTADVAAALTAELGVRFYVPRSPLHENVLFQPGTKERFRRIWDPTRSLRQDYRGARSYASTTILLHHSALLADLEHAEDVITAITKVKAASEALVVESRHS